ncbi:MAG TPA: hypothetical protein VMU89_02735 [Thermomicrobiaceae bacterium]|nr:hypothetical protein [Thermomicrobiaceae bacterium]
MRITRIYPGADGQSHFEELTVPLGEGRVGWVSALVPGGGTIFRVTRPGWSNEFHCAPRRQFVVTLSGAAEISCGDGTSRRFGPGDVMLADDTTGQGHVTRELEPERRSLFLPVADDFDVAAWRTPPGTA